MPPPVPIARLRILARLRRVNRQIAAWDELEAMALLPPTLRGEPHSDRWPEVPELDREELVSLREVLLEALAEEEAREGDG